jgi:hypothetical protein
VDSVAASIAPHGGESAVGDQQIEAAIEIFSEAVARVDRARAA